MTGDGVLTREVPSSGDTSLLSLGLNYVLRAKEHEPIDLFDLVLSSGPTDLLDP